jgi:hypothetical protein
MGLRINSLVAIAALVSACDGGGFPDAAPELTPPGGTFSVAWAVTDATGKPITCDRIAATNIAVELRSHDTANAFHDSFGCGSGQGTSLVVPPGSYDISFELVGTYGTLATASDQVNVAIASGQDTQLAPLTFAVDARGAVALHVTTGRPGGNCGAISAMGAGITAMTLTLQHTSGGCEPVTLTIAPGATKPGSTYTVNCASPQIAACIEKDQLVSAGNVPSDRYVLRIRGKIGAQDCWANVADEGLQVPPLGKTVNQTFTLTKLSGPGC